METCTRTCRKWVVFKALAQGQLSGGLTHMDADRAASAAPTRWTPYHGAITVLLAVTVSST